MKSVKREYDKFKERVKDVFAGPRGCGYEQISMKIIEKVEDGDHSELAKREIYWQHQMRCYVQNGGGGHCYRKEK